MNSVGGQATLAHGSIAPQPLPLGAGYSSYSVPGALSPHNTGSPPLLNVPPPHHHAHAQQQQPQLSNMVYPAVTSAAAAAAAAAAGLGSVLPPQSGAAYAPPPTPQHFARSSPYPPLDQVDSNQMYGGDGGGSGGGDFRTFEGVDVAFMNSLANAAGGESVDWDPMDTAQH